MHNIPNDDAWALIAPHVDAVAEAATNMRTWKRAHPGTSAHLKLARKVYAGPLDAALQGLFGAVRPWLLPSWGMEGWGFFVHSSFGSARWSSKGGKGRDGWGNLRLTGAGLGDWAGRMLAAARLAQPGPTRPFLVLHQTDDEAMNNREPHAHILDGVSHDDAFGRGVATGRIGRSATSMFGAHTSFCAALARIANMRATDVAFSDAPLLADKVFGHPVTKRLKFGQDDKISYYRLAFAQPFIFLGTSMEERARAMDRHDNAFRAIVAFLDSVPLPPKGTKLSSWKASNDQGPYTVQAWSRESAAAAFCLSALEVKAPPPAPQTVLALMESVSVPF